MKPDMMGCTAWSAAWSSAGSAAACKPRGKSSCDGLGKQPIQQLDVTKGELRHAKA